MKKWMILTVLVALCCSCDKNEIEYDSCAWLRELPIDNTIAGSLDVFYSGYELIYEMEFEASFDGEPLQELQVGNIETSGTGSNTSLFISSIWKDETYLSLLIPEIPLYGEPGNVSFYHIASSATVFSGTRDLAAENPWHNLTEYTSVPVSVRGSFRRSDVSTRCSISRIPYNCDIEIECIVEGKSLKFDIVRNN